MSDEETGNDLGETKWNVNLDWLKENRRSFSALAQRSICDKCRKKLKAVKGEIPADKLIASLKSCCSKEKGYVRGELPIMENIFRLVMAGGNEPISLTELGEQLRKNGSGTPGKTSPEILHRLLTKDRFYGLAQVQD